MSELGIDQTDAMYGITPKAAARAATLGNIKTATVDVHMNDIAFFPVTVLHEGELQTVHIKMSNSAARSAAISPSAPRVRAHSLSKFLRGAPAPPGRHNVICGSAPGARCPRHVCMQVRTAG